MFVGGSSCRLPAFALCDAGIEPDVRRVVCAAVQAADTFIDPVVVRDPLDLAQQMILRHRRVQIRVHRLLTRVFFPVRSLFPLIALCPLSVIPDPRAFGKYLIWQTKARLYFTAGLSLSKELKAICSEEKECWGRR